MTDPVGALALFPFALLRRKNPIFGRELVALLRSKKAFVLLGVYLAISMAIVLLSWPREATSLVLQGAVSRELFSIFTLGQTLLLALLIPATLGACMTSEKEGETIDLLLTTPVSADNIVLGKLASGLSYFLLLELASVPILLLCFVLGGLSSEDIFGLYLYLTLQILLYGLTSVNCSIYFHRTHIAVILAYVLVGIEAVVMNRAYGDGLAFLSGGEWIFFLLFGVPALIGFYVAARAGVRKPYSPVPKTLEEENTSDRIGLIIRRDAYPDKLIVPPRRRRLLQDGVNPVLDKELQAEIYGAGSLFIRLVIQLGTVLSLVMLFWVLGSVVARGNYDLQPEYPYLCFIIGYIMILAPSIAATTFTHEKTEHTLESLVLTLIPRRRIMMGKFLAISRVVGALTLLNCFCFLIITFLSSFQFSQLLALAILVLIVTCLTTSIGMTLSLFCRTTLAATISTYFVLFALFLGPVLLQMFLTRMFPGLPLESFSFLNYLSPFLACRVTSLGSFRMLQILLLHGLWSIGTSAALLALMTLRFEKVIERQAETL
ncbi:MAG TPA: ABC transporter permease subunit [Planctomycetota bacterium]|nr:ABC transporter permease subunit [Planctomycetota bacterium]